MSSLGTSPPFPLVALPEPLRRYVAELAEATQTPPDLAATGKGCAFAPRCRYARDRCSTDTPPLKQVADGHFHACWYPVERGEAEVELPRRIADTRGLSAPSQP